MKKTIAVLGSAAALSLSVAGLAAAQEAETDAQPTDTQQTDTQQTEAQQTDAPGVTTDQEATGQEATGQEPTGQETTAEEGTPAQQQDGDDDVDAPETPEEVSEVAQQLCGTVTAYDFLGSADGVTPGLSGEECEENADQAVEAAMNGEISEAIDILRGIDSELGDASGSAEFLDALADDDADQGGDTDEGEETDGNADSDTGEADVDATGDTIGDLDDDTLTEAGI